MIGRELPSEEVAMVLGSSRGLSPYGWSTLDNCNKISSSGRQNFDQDESVAKQDRIE